MVIDVGRTVHMDDISDTVCSVIDAAELCRNVHPDESFRNAASSSFSELSAFIQDLNADVDLYRALRDVTCDRALMRTLAPEQRRTAEALRQEYERDGIHLDASARKRVVKLQNDITDISMEFQRVLMSAREYVDIPIELMRTLPRSILAVCENNLQDPRMLRVPTDVHVVNTVLKWIGDPEVRREMYIKGNTCAKENLEVLDELRSTRHELATCLGYDSYADFALSDRMYTSPEKVVAFIEAFATQLKPKAAREVQLLTDAKHSREGRSSGRLEMWDVPFYMGMVLAQDFHLSSHGIASYFPLERCLDGFHLLCRELFGIHLVEQQMAKHESWHSDVKKLALQRDDGSTLGIIYLDLQPRAHKYLHAAHFAVRCGKRLPSGGYQTPIVALVCNFDPPPRGSPTLLTHSEVETLFHEFGHALHSLLSRTEFQHLSGTRASLDFVETPSHLFEYFAWDDRVVREFARHYKTQKAIPQDMMKRLRASKHMFAAMDAQTQCLYSLLDLTLFGKQPLPATPPSTTQVLRDLQSKFTLVPHVDGTCWHTRFGHLVGYGAGYYSYLYSRVFASAIWQTCFQADPLNRDAGKMLFEKMLVHGGARDPHEILVDMIGTEPMSARFLQQELGVPDA